MFPPSSQLTKLSSQRRWRNNYRRGALPLYCAGERALWLNLSGLPDSEKRRIAGAPVEPVQALFGPALTLTQQRCDDKKEDEAFKLCLPRRATPHLPPTMR
ncbi:hypothetical protein SKAU_G00155090 [Synaphobranchus kaupii]|uniref:Uncharacterized protein n=1 Tax=Synaphobranchus kaupii TaxID=118154 RepID=A0A9Q1FHE8_SYNKA|nr:hypothetical protein SKAU_G00155090 [Synaphobranchus kaupii]